VRLAPEHGLGLHELPKATPPTRLGLEHVVLQLRDWKLR
jgi:hypothetical protein